MRWPLDILDAFACIVEVAPDHPVGKGDVIQLLLDETARRAVWRADGDSGRLAAACNTPFTPFASAVEGLGSKRELRDCHVTLKAQAELGLEEAVNRFHGFMEKNAHLICDHFKDQKIKYDDHERISRS